jgi:6-phosphogluconolactonase (cycloisomerase 2 family)
MRVSRFSFVDSVHACKLSPDQSLLFTANRGLNHITIYDYPANTIRLRVKMPEIQEFLPIERTADPRLGFHHGHLVAADA